MEKLYSRLPLLVIAFMIATAIMTGMMSSAFKGSVEESVARCIQAQDQIRNVGQSVEGHMVDLGHHIRSDADETLVYLKILVIQPGIQMSLAREIARAVHQHSSDLKKDPDLMLAIIKGESSFNPAAKSPVGALGLMQVYPSWSKTACAGLDLKDISDNILCGIRIYSFYEEQYKEMSIALTVYNRGPNPVDHALASGKDPSNGYSAKILDIYGKLREIDQPPEVAEAE